MCGTTGNRDLKFLFPLGEGQDVSDPNVINHWVSNSIEPDQIPNINEVTPSRRDSHCRCGRQIAYHYPRLQRCGVNGSGIYYILS